MRWLVGLVLLLLAVNAEAQIIFPPGPAGGGVPVGGSCATTNGVAAFTASTTLGCSGVVASSGAVSSVTTMSMSGQLTNTVSTGTAPFVVSSTTVVGNLNVSQLLGATWAAPAAIGSTTPAAGTFTTLKTTGTTVTFQSAGVTGTLTWSPGTSNKTITLPNGTTDFTATGGTSQVVQQASAGAAFTVGQLAASDLSNGTTGTGGTAVVLATSPTLVTPVLGVATATSLSTPSLISTGDITISPNSGANDVVMAGRVYPTSDGGGALGIVSRRWGTGYFSTSIINPLLIGGAGTTSTLTYKTTTANGTTGADHIFLVGNNGGTEALRIKNDASITVGGTATVAAATCTVAVTAITIKNGLVTAVSGTGC